MLIWIDAASPHSLLRVFGMTASERHLRSLVSFHPAPHSITIDCGTNKPDDLGIPSSLLKKLPVKFLTSTASFVDRLQKFLYEADKNPVLLLDGTNIADKRLHVKLPRSDHAIVVFGQNGDRDAAMIYTPNPKIQIPAEIANLYGFATFMIERQFASELTQAEFNGFIRNLRRSVPFYLFRLSSQKKANEVERFLFWSNYKGSTDLFTRYVYPPAVWLLVRPLAKARIHPNWVTIVSILMTFAAIPFFYNSHFIFGFALAFGMSILDSVDGKLARLTFTDSAIGNVLDHGLDIIHPPLWYLAWAFGLGLSSLPWGSPLGIAAILIVTFYVADRLILKIYPLFFGRGFHTHSKLDATLRAIIARRNINLPLFLLGWAFGFGIEAFYFITLWQGLTAAYHGIRTLWILGIQREHQNRPRNPAEIATKL